MNRNHFFTETSYGYKRSRRNVIFWIFVFVFLSIVIGIGSYEIILYQEGL